MMPLWPMVVLLVVIGVWTVAGGLGIIHAHRKDVAQRKMWAKAQGEDAGGDLAVSPLHE